MLWEIHQQGRIHTAVAEAEAASNKAERTSADIARLQAQVERLSLACQAMWELLRDHTALTEQMLDDKIVEVDTRDGRADGKMSRHIMDCPKCGHKTNSRRTSCILCGAALSKPHKFEG